MQNKESIELGASESGSCCSSPERCVTENPGKAVGAAFGVGLVLSFLPVGKIAGMLIDVAFSLVRPVLLVTGLLKISECCRPGCVPDNAPDPKQTNQP